MARVNLYISNEVHEKINMIVEKRRQEGARDKDISLSGTASMLLELGFAYMMHRWSVKSLRLTRQSLINFFLNVL